ncbi:MAG: 4'-phosphopantetheinyl transferase superfamily protein [Cyanobacteria bacterium J06621_11]
MKDTVQVWQIPLQVSNDILEAYESCLSVDERSRADRFRFPDDKRRFTVARGTLRHLLSQQFACLPEQISFCYGKYGKPSIEPIGSAGQTTARSSNLSESEHCDFHFNISHSGELALCVLGHRHRVGIDIERFKEIQRLESMMERCLSPLEQTQVQASENPLEAFLTYWTCKEAYLKAIGLGLSQPMTTVEVDMDLLKLIRVPDDCIEGWRLHAVTVPDGYAAALVVAGDSLVEFKRWHH